MTVPKCGFASTLTHGAGVTCPCAVVMTYSRPSGVNPPSPLKKMQIAARQRGGLARVQRDGFGSASSAVRVTSAGRDD